MLHAWKLLLIWRNINPKRHTPLPVGIGHGVTLKGIDVKAPAQTRAGRNQNRDVRGMRKARKVSPVNEERGLSALSAQRGSLRGLPTAKILGPERVKAIGFSSIPSGVEVRVSMSWQRFANTVEPNPLGPSQEGAGVQVAG
jgi:hypothetical protein